MKRSTAWLAAAAFALCSFSVEYALGLWPQSLSIALCVAAIILAGGAIESSRATRAAMSGLLFGIATGVRYQNAALLLTVAGAIFLWSKRRILCSVAYMAAASPPVLLNAIINHERLNSWNPISKGPGYLNVPIVQDASGSWLDPLTMFWARVGDYSFRPHLFTRTFDGWVTYDALTGAHLIYGFAVKKSLLQSAPWAIVGLLAMLLAWTRRPRAGDTQQRQIQLLSLVTFTLVAIFSFSGIWRDDGLSFNQRYLLETVPLLAIVFAWSLDRIALPVRAIAIGAGAGLVVAIAILTTTPMAGQPSAPLWTLRLYALLKVPLFLAAAFAWSWIFVRFSPRAHTVLALSAGACLGWGAALQLLYDVPIAQSQRRIFMERTRVLAANLPDQSALIAYWGMKEAAGPLRLNRDVVVLDPRIDQGADAPVLIRELLQQKRRVFLLDEYFPDDLRARVVEGFLLKPVGDPTARLQELEPSPN